MFFAESMSLWWQWSYCDSVALLCQGSLLWNMVTSRPTGDVPSDCCGWCFSGSLLSNMDCAALRCVQQACQLSRFRTHVFGIPHALSQVLVGRLCYVGCGGVLFFTGCCCSCSRLSCLHCSIGAQHLDKAIKLACRFSVTLLTSRTAADCIRCHTRQSNCLIGVLTTLYGTAQPRYT